MCDRDGAKRESCHRLFPFINQPTPASVLNLRQVDASRYAILPPSAPNDKAINHHLRLYSRSTARAGGG